MGHRIQVTHREPTQPSTGSSGGVSGGRLHRAVLSCGGTLRTPRYGRDGLTRAVRWNGGVPVAHDIAARRAFYPGRG